MPDHVASGASELASLCGVVGLAALPVLVGNWRRDELCDFREDFVQSFFRSDRQVQGMFMASAPSLLPYRFSEIAQPVLCMRGQKQQFLSRQTDFYAPKLPNGKRVVIPDAGHFLLFENDPAVYQEIFAFLAPMGRAAVRQV